LHTFDSNFEITSVPSGQSSQEKSQHIARSADNYISYLLLSFTHAQYIFLKKNVAVQSYPRGGLTLHTWEILWEMHNRRSVVQLCTLKRVFKKPSDLAKPIGNKKFHKIT